MIIKLGGIHISQAAYIWTDAKCIGWKQLPKELVITSGELPTVQYVQRVFFNVGTFNGGGDEPVRGAALL